MTEEEFLDIDITDEEVEYLILKYIRDQTALGRDKIPVAEIYEYLNAEAPDEEELEEVFAVLTGDAEAAIARFEAKNRLN
jgi:hypothetical protein